MDNGEADGEEGDSPMRWFEDGEAGELAEKGMLSDSPQWQSGLGLRKLAKELGERGTEHLEIAKKMWESLKPPVGAPVATHREQRPPGIDMGHTPREDDDAKAATPPNASSSGRTPWSPLTRPMVTAFQEGVVKPGQIMGKRLAEVWDIHDLFDDGEDALPHLYVTPRPGWYTMCTREPMLCGRLRQGPHRGQRGRQHQIPVQGTKSPPWLHTRISR